MNDTNFTIERYQKLVVEEKTHRVETSRDDIRVRIICTDRAGDWPVVGLVATSTDGDYEAVYNFPPTGENADFQLRIVPIPPKSLGWVGVYRNQNEYNVTGFYGTKEALLGRWDNLIAIHEFFEGDGITQS